MNNSTRHLLETCIVSTAELSALTGLPVVTLQKQAERGQADYVKKGRTYLFDRRDFARQIASQSQIASHGGVSSAEQEEPSEEVISGAEGLEQ